MQTALGCQKLNDVSAGSLAKETPEIYTFYPLEYLQQTKPDQSIGQFLCSSVPDVAVLQAKWSKS